MISTVSVAFLIWHIIPLVTVFICALLIFIIRGNQYPINIVGYAFLAASASLAVLLFLDFPETSDYIDLFEPNHSLGAILLIPIIFFYFFELMSPGYINWKKVVAVYAPIVFLIIIRVVAACGQELPLITDYKIFFEYIGYFEMLVRLLTVMFLFAMPLTLTIIAFRLYFNYKKEIFANFSDDKGVRLKWMPLAIIMTEFYSFALIVSITLVAHWPKNLTSLSLTIVPLFITSVALRQRNLFEVRDLKDDHIQDKPNTNKKSMYFNQLKEQLIVFLEKDEIYKDADLTAEKVCVMLGTNRTYLSQLIKNEFQNNFYGLINSYRLEKAHSYIQNKEEYIHVPIKNIAEIAGFKNVSTFNKLFKEKYGVTPLECKDGKLEKH